MSRYILLLAILTAPLFAENTSGKGSVVTATKVSRDETDRADSDKPSQGAKLAIAVSEENETQSQGGSLKTNVGLLLNLLTFLLLAWYVWLRTQSRSTSKNSASHSDDIESWAGNVGHQGGPPRLSNSVEKRIQQIHDIVTKIQNSNQEVRDLKQQAAGFEQRVNSVKNDKEKAESKAQDLLAKVSELNAEKSGLEGQLSDLRAQCDEIPKLKDDLADSRRREEDTINKSKQEVRAAHDRFRRLLPVVEADAALGQSVAELEAASANGDDDARAALSALIFFRAAEAGKVEEEALLSVLRQFSESLVCYLKSTGCNPFQVVDSLAQWAAFLGQKFEGRAKLRVPSIGYPVEAHVMLEEGGVSKVSEVVSWCVYNSKDGVFAAARVR